jgi:hypothetical protein
MEHDLLESFGSVLASTSPEPRILPGVAIVLATALGENRHVNGASQTIVSHGLNNLTANSDLSLIG